MERTKHSERRPIFILTSDWHLREDAPTCFTGDWHQEQWKAVEVIRSIQAKYKCPILHAGDLFHNWKASPGLLTQAILLLPDQFYTVYGQHDLPQHNWELRSKSGLRTLEAAARLTVLPGYHYGQEIYTGANTYGPFGKVLVWHHMTYINIPFPGATVGQAQGILMKYPQFNLILTGDNHQSFTTSHEGRVLVNPGPITRQKADQINFKPRVALYFEGGTIEWYYLPMQEGVISREHLDVTEQRDNRISAFISKLDDEWETELSFEDNLERFKNKNDINPKVMELVYKAIHYQRDKN